MATRAQALAALGACALLPACATRNAIRVGSKNFTESLIIAEIYAQTLERAGYHVVRHLNLGSTEIAMQAMRRGDIDLYPEYTGTALIDVLHHAPVHDEAEMYRVVRAAFARDYAIAWLRPSPMNDSQGLATTRAIAQRFHIQTLSQLAPLANRLRLATIPEFLTRPDGLPGLQRLYGGFHFENVRTYDIALKYDALLSGHADVATAFTTDGAIASHDLVVLRDDRGLWPPYHVAPVVRMPVAKREPRLVAALDRISPHITSERAAQMNAAVEDQDQEPADVAARFLKALS